MFAGARGICVETLDDQIKGRRSYDIEIPVDARRTPHFVRRSVKISETDFLWNTNPPSLQEPAHGKLINEQRIGFVAIKPITELGGVDVFAWNERFAPIPFG